MKDQNDVRAAKSVRNVLTRRGLDISRADIRVMKGRVEIRGLLSALKGSEIEDLEAEMLELAKLIRRKQDIKDVSVEVTYR